MLILHKFKLPVLLQLFKLIHGIEPVVEDIDSGCYDEAVYLIQIVEIAHPC
jgi:hypothetical protein